MSIMFTYNYLSLKIKLIQVNYRLFSRTFLLLFSRFFPLSLFKHKTWVAKSNGSINSFLLILLNVTKMCCAFCVLSALDNKSNAKLSCFDFISFLYNLMFGSQNPCYVTDFFPSGYLLCSLEKNAIYSSP